MHPIRVVVIASALISTVVSTTGLSDHPPLAAWQIIAGWVLVLVFTAAMVFGMGRPNFALAPGAIALSDGWRTDSLIAICISVPLLIVVLRSGSLTWLAFVVVVIAAGSQQVPTAIAASAPSAVALGYATWHSSHSSATLFVNAIALVAVFGFVWFRRAQRESLELAEAQQKVIAHERAKAEAAQSQQEVAAQLHDVLAHTLSGLIVSLQTASLQARQEDATPQLQQRLSAATDLAKEGLHGARQAVESLHRAASASAEAAWETTDHDLADWWRHTVDQMRATTDLDLTSSGDPSGIPPQWMPIAESVLRESLTNSLRHASGRPVRVTFSANGVEVLSEGDVSTFGASSHAGGGFGLAGLRGRVEAAGGAFTAGPGAHGWLVAVTWPHSGGMP